MLSRLFSNNKKSCRDKKIIVIIGFNKTGTTSIHRLFQQAGLKSAHWDEGKLAKTMMLNVLEGRPVFEGYDRDFDVFSDMVYRTDSFWFEGNSLFRQIAMDYPNARFIYNTRDIDDWVKSRANHSEQVDGQTVLALFEKILGTTDIELINKHWRDVRLRFESDIKAFFNGKENFLEIQINEPDFATKLGAFVDMDVPENAWKQYNKTE